MIVTIIFRREALVRLAQYFGIAGSRLGSSRQIMEAIRVAHRNVEALDIISQEAKRVAAVRGEK